MAFISFGQQPEAIKTIVIDPGHGGKDNGTSGSNSVEKDLTLEVALQLKKEINSQFPNIKVILTREQDEFISLHKRSNIANLSNADLFISLHCNHIDESYVNGSEIYILGLSKADENLQIVKRENAIWDDQDNNENENEESHILFSLYQNATLSSSADFGQLLEKNLTITTTLKQRGVKQAGFSVLKNATMPSVLVEIAYLSNSSSD